MKILEITDRIQQIKDLASDDDESAHSHEDSLHRDFIAYVATLPDPILSEKAKLVLSTRDIEFSRWCA